MSRDNEGCENCQRFHNELEAFLAAQEATLPEKDIPGHDGDTRERIVTGVMLAILINRLIAELGNPFQVIQILIRSVMSRVNVQVIKMGEQEPPKPATGVMSDEELLNLENLPNA